MKAKSLQIPKGLTKKAAYKAVSKKLAGRRDFRGMTYNKRTGKVVVV